MTVGTSHTMVTNTLCLFMKNVFRDDLCSISSSFTEIYRLVQRGCYHVLSILYFITKCWDKNSQNPLHRKQIAHLLTHQLTFCTTLLQVTQDYFEGLAHFYVVVLVPNTIQYQVTSLCHNNSLVNTLYKHILTSQRVSNLIVQNNVCM